MAKPISGQSQQPPGGKSRTKHPGFRPGAVRVGPRKGRAQSHPGVHPLDAVAHRNTSFQPLPRPLGLAPYHYDLSEHFPDIADAITHDGKMVLHLIGDSGGVKDAEFQGNVASLMIDALHNGANKPHFCYHVGDVVYYNGEKSQYYAQFYEPYSQYDAPIFPIPGNHDGEVDDPTSGQTSLDGFVAAFMQANPDVDPISKDAPRVGLNLPNVYWTLVTPFATFIGIYTNVPEHGSIDSTQQQWITNEFATAPDDRALIVALHHPIYSFDTFHSGSSKMADVLENAIRDTGRVPNLVISGHVHDYQRIENHIAGETTPTPFLVIGNGGYHNLHQVHSSPGDVDSDTGATLRYAAVTYGFLTLTVDKNWITGVSTEVDRNDTVKTPADKFKYTAKPLKLANGKTVKTL
jgi:hypothetical protein